VSVRQRRWKPCNVFSFVAAVRVPELLVPNDFKARKTLGQLSLENRKQLVTPKQVVPQKGNPLAFERMTPAFAFEPSRNAPSLNSSS